MSGHDNDMCMCHGRCCLPIIYAAFTDFLFHLTNMCQTLC